MANKNVMIKNIGLDMDGVLVDLAKYQFKKGIPYFSKLKGISKSKVIKDKNAYDVEKIFDVTHSERMAFWAKYIWGYCLTEPAREYASKITHKWHNEGRKVKIITSRVYVDLNNPLGELFRKMVYYWLNKNNIYYDKVIFCKEKGSAAEKYEACEKEDIDLMVDDKIDNVNAISENNITLCYNNPWNQNGLGNKESIKRVNNFEEIDEFIIKYELENQRRYIVLPRGGVK